MISVGRSDDHYRPSVVEWQCRSINFLLDIRGQVPSLLTYIECIRDAFERLDYHRENQLRQLVLVMYRDNRLAPECVVQISGAESGFIWADD